MLSVRTYNILAQGFASPFWYVAEVDRPWVKRRDLILKALLAPVKATGDGGVTGLSPSVVCVQELQSTSRGWGRLVEGDGGDDHAQWLRLKMAAAGYEGFYVVNDDTPSSSLSDPKNDRKRGLGNGYGKDGPNKAWPTETADGLGGRLGVAIFYKTDQIDLVASRAVSFSQHFRELTSRDDSKNGKAAKERLASWNGAIIALLALRTTGALVTVATTHFPTPKEGKEVEVDAVAVAGAVGLAGAPAASKTPPPAEPAPGAVQQVQFTEALCHEIKALLTRTGLEGNVPVIITGDLNAMPGSACHTLLTSGSLAQDRIELASRFKKQKTDPTEFVPAKIVLPYMTPSCGGGGAFVSAYAAANGGREPEFTNFRRVRTWTQPAAVAVAVVVAAESMIDVPTPLSPEIPTPTPAAAAEPVELPPFAGTLDYILARNPLAGTARAGVPSSYLTLVGVETLPERAYLEAQPEKALPSSTHPSDHLALTATYKLTLV